MRAEVDILVDFPISHFVKSRAHNGLTLRINIMIKRGGGQKQRSKGGGGLEPSPRT